MQGGSCTTPGHRGAGLRSSRDRHGVWGQRRMRWWQGNRATPGHRGAGLRSGRDGHGVWAQRSRADVERRGIVRRPATEGPGYVRAEIGAAYGHRGAGRRWQGELCDARPQRGRATFGSRSARLWHRGSGATFGPRVGRRTTRVEPLGLSSPLDPAGRDSGWPRWPPVLPHARP